MKRILPATLISAILAVAAFGAISANAAMPTKNASAIVAEPAPPQATEITEPEGTEAAEPAEAPGAADVGHADDPTDANADQQFDGEQ